MVANIMEHANIYVGMKTFTKTFIYTSSDKWGGDDTEY